MCWIKDQALEERALKVGGGFGVSLPPITYHPSPLDYHLSRITCHLSLITYHLSLVTYCFSLIASRLQGHERGGCRVQEAQEEGGRVGDNPLGAPAAPW